MAWSRHSSQQTQLLDLLHPLDDRDAEGHRFSQFPQAMQSSALAVRAW